MEEVFKWKDPARKTILLKQLLFAKIGVDENTTNHLDSFVR